MHELIDFLSQPLAMELTSARSFVASLREPSARQQAEFPQPYCLDEEASLVEMAAMETVGGGSKLTAIVPLWGVLTMHGGWFSSSLNQFASTITKLDQNEAVQTIIVHVNSPGGSVSGTIEAANALRAVRERGATRTITVAEPMMASAALWVGTASAEVVVTPSGDAGSVGVISMYENWQKALEMMGIEINIMRSPANKARFSGVEPLDDSMREVMQTRNAAAYGLFLDAMAKNRNVTAKQAEKRFGNGEMLSAAEAKAEGLIDRVATFSEVIAGVTKKRSSGGVRAEDEAPQPTAEELAAERRKRLEAVA
jgi:signal peptide peptidase SppA